jgi:Flp pilus assembly protein TadG
MNTVCRTRQSIAGGSRGQALVEFAVTIVVLLALVFGVIEIARIMLCYTTVANAARVGARYAITNSSVPGTTATFSGVSTIKSNITTVVQNFAAAGTLNTSSTYLTVSVSYPDGGTCTSTSTSCTGTTAGNRVSVSVSYTYDPLLTYFSLGTIHLTSTSQGVITW